MKKIVALLLFLQACAPSSMDDFRCEGEALCRALTEELKKIQTREELLDASPKLKGYFNQLAALMIAARSFQKESEESFMAGNLGGEASDALLAEMRRLYKLEAGREIIEKAQKEALLKLDSFENRLRK